MSTNYKILWQQLARHLINKKPFKHRDEVKMGNEPTKPLKNMKKAIHPRYIPNAPLLSLSHDPKYGGWIDPYEFRVKPKKKEKKFEYY